MPLDIFLANNQNEINEHTPHFPMKESNFNNLISNANPIKSFPIINKISDYYSDNVLNSSEIKSLIIELRKINIHNTFISSLIDFLENSEETRAFFFSD